MLCVDVQLANCYTCKFHTIIAKSKMADESVVLCSVLCFLKYKFGKSNVKLLKMALTDYYDTDASSEAKVRLLSDISAINLPVKMPHIPHRRWAVYVASA